MSSHIGVFVAWPYANGELHLGHIAGAYLPADIFARYHRLRGNKVIMISGSDTHGTPITLKAKEEQCTPFEVVLRYHDTFLEGFKKLGISFDLFTHTHTNNHIAVTQDIFNTLLKNGDLEIQTQKQFYDNSAKMFLPDRYVGGSCPLCDYTRARGDQCENCGKTFDAVELKSPVSLISNTTPSIEDTQHFFFRMDHYKEKLSQYVESNPHWRPHVQNFTRMMVQDGLRPRAITRDIDWGVPVPVSGWENKVIYVWFDAVIGYLSGSIEWASYTNDKDAWKKWWKNKEARSYYFIGKDNIPFHSVIWPVELMAYNPELNLPYDVPANQFLNAAGEKFSTSRGTAIWLSDILKEYDVDAVRYYLASILPETKDANFYYQEMATRNNGELAATWGNLVHRVIGFAHGRYDGKIPTPQELDERDKALLSTIEKGFAIVGKAYDEVRLRDALKETMNLAREVNRYLDEKAPWSVFKIAPEAAGTTIYTAMNAIDSLKILFAPVLPNTCEEIHRYFSYKAPLFGSLEIVDKMDNGEKHKVLQYENIEEEELGVDRWKPSKLTASTPFLKSKPLFKQIETKDKE